MPLTAEELQLQYGAELVLPPLCDVKSPYLFQKLLDEGYPNDSRCLSDVVGCVSTGSFVLKTYI